MTDAGEAARSRAAPKQSQSTTLPVAEGLLDASCASSSIAGVPSAAHDSVMEEFLYVLRARRPGMVADGPTPEEEPILSEHGAYLGRLASEGTVILAGRTQEADERAFGIVIFRAEDREAADRIAREDPAVKAGMMNVEIHPFRVAFSSDP